MSEISADYERVVIGTRYFFFEFYMEDPTFIFEIFFFFGGLKLKRDKKMKDSIILCEFNSF